MKLVTKNEKP